MDENRKQIISAMTYPAVIFVVAIIVLVYIILYVVPEFTAFLSLVIKRYKWYR